MNYLPQNLVSEAVAYLGPFGTFSHLAAQAACPPQTRLVPYKDFAAIFAAVDTGQCGAGLVPLENSLNGSIVQCFDLFSTHTLFIHAELFFRISHSLLSREKDMQAIQRVYSHAQPLAQCAHWLRANLPQAELVETASTAQAAQRAVGEAGSAALGHYSLGGQEGLHSLSILARSIEDDADNWTRFVLIRKEPPQGALREGRTSLMFTLKHAPGALVEVLQIFAGAGINLRKLESRPLRKERWHYIFFADLECDCNQPRFKPVLEQLEQSCQALRILGCYEAGAYIDAP